MNSEYDEEIEIEDVEEQEEDSEEEQGHQCNGNGCMDCLGFSWRDFM